MNVSVRSQIRKHLARRRMVGVEVAVEENDSHGRIGMAMRLSQRASCRDALPADKLAYPRSTTHSPITNKSIFVRRKQSSASCGVHTTGSFSLKEVFSTIGTPDSSRNASINE